MFIELHLIQSFAPSNLNRDDTNNPKDCEFGGVRRARISSQCIKRAVRTNASFREHTGVPIGTRTRFMTRLITERLIKAGKDPESAQKVSEAFAASYAKMDKTNEERSSVLVYLSQMEVEQIVNSLLAQWEPLLAEKDFNKSKVLKDIAKDLFKKIKGRTSAPDIALFGRMLAENPTLNLDAACQVAHAISTHRVNMEMDFFTAVDDLNREDETGSGMMGIIGFNSACFYRYSRVDTDQLLKNLGGDMDLAIRTLRGFLWASILAIPTGKQTSFAAQNPPAFAMAVVREDGQSWSLVNAFEKPVRPSREGGYLKPSIEALASYWEKLTNVYGADNLHASLINTVDDADILPLKDFASNNVKEMVDKVCQSVRG